MTDKQNIAKDITSAVLFEEDLQMSWKENGICVVDVYSEEWGSCKAIAPTFRRLYFEAEESMKLKILTVNATSLLNEMNGTSADIPRREFQRPKDAAAIKDTLPEAWKPFMLEQTDNPKPLFLFFKEGKLHSVVRGVHTPLICETVKDLTSIKTPASEFITNTSLLETWGAHFNPNESEVKWETFLHELNVICKLTVPLNDEESTAVKKVLKVDKDRIVSAAELQNWVSGVSNTGTILQAFTQLLPNYEERAIQVRIEHELEEKRLAAEREKEEHEKLLHLQRERELKQKEERSKKLERPVAPRPVKEGEDFYIIVRGIQTDIVNSSVQLHYHTTRLELRVNTINEVVKLQSIGDLVIEFLMTSDGQTSRGTFNLNNIVKDNNLIVNLLNDDGDCVCKVNCCWSLTPIEQVEEEAKVEINILEACKAGQLDQVKEYIAQHGDLNVRDDEKNTPLHISAMNGHLPIVLLLHESGAVHTKNSEGQTPIFVAQEAGAINVVNALMEVGINF